MVEKVNEYGMRKTILIGQESYYIALPCVVSGTANGVIKAGLPLNGNIEKRDTAFVAATTGNDAKVAVGVNLHDVQLDKNGKGNATLVIAGCIDLLKLESDVKTAVASHKASLPKIIFVEGSAI